MGQMQYVEAVAAVELVAVAGVGVNRVIAGSGFDDVLAGAGPDGVVIGTAVEGLVASAAPPSGALLPSAMR
jgi:hypothetical protein